MKRILSTTALAALCSVGFLGAAQAQDKTRSAPSGQEQAATMSGDPSGMKSGAGTHSGAAAGSHAAMDTNGDGYVSRAEYMKYHESQWGTMKKNNKGMVSASDIPGLPKVGDAAPNPTGGPAGATGVNAQMPGTKK